MDIIVLIIFGFLLLAFVLIFSPRHADSVQRMMRQNHNVKPLFKEKSALIKYRALHDALKDNPSLLKRLEKLEHNFKDKLIDLEVYYDALEQIEVSVKQTTKQLN